MLKKVGFLFFALLFSYSSFAQNNIAILKFQEAEEAYSKENYSAALSSLSEAEKILKTTNPKIQHLKILAQAALIEKDPYADFTLLESARKNAAFYLKQYGDDAKLSEKFAQVYKINEKLKTFPSNPAQLSTERTKMEASLKAEKLAEEQIREKKALASALIDYGNSLLSKYPCKFGLTESEFIDYAGLSKYKWSRNGSFVFRNVGSPMSVGGYLTEGPRAYRIDGSGKVYEYTFGTHKIKNGVTEANEIFESLKAKDAKWKSYFTSKNNTYFIEIPLSPNQPDIISYRITISNNSMEKWGFLNIMFNQL